MMYFNEIFKQIFLISVFFLSITFFSNAQNTDSAKFKLPLVILKTLEGKNISTSEITNEGKPIILIIWKSCCPANINMLNDINDFYSDWQKETGVVVYAISIDDSRNSSKIAPLVNVKGWEYKILLDSNADFKRAMNIVATPHIFILNRENDIVWQKTTYNAGEIDEIYRELKKISK